ncbi:MAG: Ca2+-dependent phosphoinositide-specific phospholipase C [bacterium]
MPLLILAGACDPMGDAPLDGGVIDGGDQGEGDGTVIEDALVEPLRLNHMQVRGTVNSYHDSRVPPIAPHTAYWHLPLDQQAAVQGIRQFDFDVYGDGHTLSVQHMVGLSDRVSHCGGLLPCLEGIAAWSDANPDHPPLVILMGESWIWPDIDLQFYWHVDEIEDYLLFALGRERMLSPADVRGEHPDLATAIAIDGWPTIDETRGKIIAVLNEHDEARAEYLEYGGLDPDDRFLFQIGDPAEPSPDEVIFSFEGRGDGATEPWMEVIDEALLPEIERLVRSGALVHAATNDPAMVPRLRAAGAHMIASRWPDDVLGAPDMPPSQCNPVTAPLDCRAERIEAPVAEE